MTDEEIIHRIIFRLNEMHEQVIDSLANNCGGRQDRDDYIEQQGCARGIELCIETIKELFLMVAEEQQCSEK